MRPPFVGAGNVGIVAGGKESEGDGPGSGRLPAKPAQDFNAGFTLPIEIEKDQTWKRKPFAIAALETPGQDADGLLGPLSEDDPRGDVDPPHRRLEQTGDIRVILENKDVGAGWRRRGTGCAQWR